jgi:hypothetical protein
MDSEVLEDLDKLMIQLKKKDAPLGLMLVVCDRNKNTKSAFAILENENKTNNTVTAVLKRLQDAQQEDMLTGMLMSLYNVALEGFVNSFDFEEKQ